MLIFRHQAESQRAEMSITYESEISESMLIVTASGRDEDVQQVIDYGLSIIRLAVESGATHILCDERNLEYALGTFDTYDVAKQIAVERTRGLPVWRSYANRNS